MVLDGPPIAVTLPKNLSHSPRARPAVRAALADAKRNSVTPDIGHRQPAAENSKFLSRTPTPHLRGAALLFFSSTPVSAISTSLKKTAAPI
jgi:hypothetical protein